MGLEIGGPNCSLATDCVTRVRIGYCVHAPFFAILLDVPGD